MSIYLPIFLNRTTRLPVVILRCGGKSSEVFILGWVMIEKTKGIFMQTIFSLTRNAGARGLQFLNSIWLNIWRANYYVLFFLLAIHPYQNPIIIISLLFICLYDMLERRSSLPYDFIRWWGAWWGRLLDHILSVWEDAWYIMDFLWCVMWMERWWL